MIGPDIVIGPVSGDGLALLVSTMRRKPAAPDLWARVRAQSRAVARR